MIINGTPEWTHITRDGRKAAIVTDKVEETTYPVMAVAEEAVGSDKFWFGYFTLELKYHADGRESKNDLRPYNPFDGVQVNTPMWVRQPNGSWQRRHFAYVQDGKVYAWIEGKTSFTETTANMWLDYSFTDPTSEL